MERGGRQVELTRAVDGDLSLEALQMQLYPAESQVPKLAASQPATLVLSIA